MEGWQEGGMKERGEREESEEEGKEALHVHICTHTSDRHTSKVTMAAREGGGRHGSGPHRR